jgi:bacillithiol system protein YtxJ
MMFKSITSEAELNDALSQDVAVLYKHSTRCGGSRVAFNELERFVKAHPGTPVYIIDVIRDRPVSNRVADQLGVYHQSPQAIVLHHGEPVWNASHYRVTEDAVAAQVALKS